MSKFDYWQKFEENNIYHIYNRGINGTNIFQNDNNFHFFIKRWKTRIDPFLDTLGYCLMPNHFHFLVKVNPIAFENMEQVRVMNTSKSKNFLKGEISYNDFLEAQFKRLFSSYALAFNKQQNRSGSLFQKRFKRVRMGNNKKTMNMLAYIHHNPVHHKFTFAFDEWEYSSYSAYLTNKSTFVNRDLGLLLFDDNFETAKDLYEKFHKEFKLSRE